MRCGVCAARRDLGRVEPVPVDYLEESIQGFLAPEDSEDTLRERLDLARDLPIEAANVFIPATLPLIESREQPVDRQRIERYVRTALDRAERCGIRVIVFGSGRARACPPDLAPEHAAQQLQGLLEQWAWWGRDHGVCIALEPLCREETNLVNSVAEGGQLISPLRGSGITLTADLYHMAISGEAPGSLRPWVSLVSHVHVAESEGRAPPGAHGEDLTPYLRVLAQEGYDARISIECRWENLPVQLDLAVATLRDQWRHATMQEQT